jgi:HEAT repeat protein
MNDIRSMTFEELVAAWQSQYVEAEDCRQLFSGEWDYFEQIAIALAVSGDRGAAFLIGELPPEDSWRGSAVIVGIAESVLSRERKIEILCENLEHSNGYVRGDVLHGLTKLAYPDARSVAESMVEDEHEYVRRRAIHFLTELFPLETIHLLDNGLNDPSEAVREAVMDRIDESPEPSIPPMFEDRIWPLVEHDDFGIRYKSLYYLYDHCPKDIAGRPESRSPEATPERVRILSAYLAYDREQWDVVSRYAEDPSPLVRREAAHWIRSTAMYWTNWVTEEVIDRLWNDPDERVRAEVRD